MSNLDTLESLSKDETITTYDPKCIRQRSNWSKVKKEHKLDNGYFNADVFLNDMKHSSPKLDALLRKIADLDKKDEKKHGKKFKHFIFSDIKSGSHGAKMLAAALIATGWNLGYNSKLKGSNTVHSTSASASASESEDFSPLNLQSLGSIKQMTPSSRSKSYNFFDLIPSSKERSRSSSKERSRSSSNERSPSSSKERSRSSSKERSRSSSKEITGGSKDDDSDDNEGDNEGETIQWGPIHMLEDQDLLKSRGYNFYLLSSVSVFDKPISVKMKKDILSKFNSRPDNIYGDLARIIIMDSGFKEGIDLFDIKYVHIFEPSVNSADQKQVIGRGTRTCGQKGLEFNPIQGWPLHVFIYDLGIPDSLQKSLLGATSTFDLFMKAMNVDIRLINFGYDIERLSSFGSVDYELNQAVHNFSVQLEDENDEDQVIFGGKHLKYNTQKMNMGQMNMGQQYHSSDTMTFQKMRTFIRDNYGQYKWEDVKMENLCIEKGGSKGGAANILNYTPSQDFIRHYFKPSCPVKGMLLHHSVGTGKCHAKDTPILMYDGSIKMVQDVQVNDLLMGDNSTPRKVLSLATGVDDLYTIKPMKGDTYTVNSEHILCLKTTRLGISVIKRQVKPFCVRYINTSTVSISSKSFSTREEAEDFQDFISKDNIIEIEVNNYLKLSKHVKKNLKGYRTGVEFQNKPISIDPYIIGYWLGDGTSREPKISCRDSVVLKYMNDFAFANHLLLNYQSGCDYRFSSYDKHENKILKGLQKYNLIKNKHIPNDYKTNDRETRLQLLAGLIDSDGYHDKPGCCYEIVQKNKTLSEDILFLARSLGFAAYSKEETKKTSMNASIYSRIYISGNGLEEIPVKIVRKKQYERSINKNALVTGITVNHIGRGDYYGFTLDGNNRYLLGDFTVTHNTCSAIAAASTNFDPEGYTILWVTRTTLKNDIWKNMFGQVCNESIRNKIANGEEIPDDPKKQMRLLSKAWRIRPMSYKQFSNLVSKQNDFYKRLVKENGEADPLRKTLLIIDEAHKLYGGGDLSSLERPDMVALHDSLMKSYAISGIDSVRLLLMTATPITESPMELIQLMNLCKPIDQQMPHTFDAFSSQYLNEEGHFTQKGENDYLDAIAGHISYLNREKDARQFSQPIVKRVMVPIVNDSQIEKVQQYDKYILKTVAEERLSKIKEQAEKTNERISGELSELGKERFNYLKSICDKKVQDLPSKTCQKIINTNIKDLTDELKTYVKKMKNQLKTIKTEIKNVSQEKTKGLEKIKVNIEKHPEDFEKYKSSSYFSLRSNCGKRTRSNKKFLEHLQTDPKIIQYNGEIKVHEDHISMLSSRLGIEKEAHKLHLKQLKQELKNKALTDIEKSFIKLNIKSQQSNFKKTSKLTSKKIKQDMEEDINTIKKINKEKKNIFKNVRKTIKNRIKEEHKQMQAAIKEEKMLRKTMRKQSDLKDDIKDEEANNIVKKYEAIIDNTLEKAIIESKEEMKKKKQAEQAKEEEKRIKEKAREETKRVKDKAKEIANQAKANAKEIADQAKAKAKEIAKEKANAKEIAKEKAKTEKIRIKKVEMEQKRKEKAARKTKKKSPKK
jgi:hypothetical protein